MSNWNTSIIKEFRENGGKVGGMFEGTPLLLLTTIGAKSGKSYTSPLAYLQEGDNLYIFASKAGADTNPDWYYNVLAHPTVTIEIGTEKFEAKAVVVTGEERDRIYAKQVERSPQFGEYQKKTTRIIPVISLQRIA